MYSLYPNRTIGFFWWVDRRNCSLADVEAFLADADFALEGPSSLFSESDSRRFDSPLSVSYSSIFFFPFSLRVNSSSSLFPCMVESPLFANSSLHWSFRLSLSFGPLSQNEIGLSSRVSIISSFSSSSGIMSGSLVSSSVIGWSELSRVGVGVGVGKEYQ